MTRIPYFPLYLFI